MRSYVIALLCALTACIAQPDSAPSQPVSAGGVTQAVAKVTTGADGLTAEQRNIRDRLAEDNKPGAIKHLYVISAYSGQVLIYSTVRGKVTSGGKRLTPTSIYAGCTGGQYNAGCWGQDWNGNRTAEVIQDDGTYGTSGDYLYWWDTRGVYHQHYVQGGQIVHISSEPLNIPHIVLNLNETKADAHP